ncbi:hypothetical protein VCHENC02_3231, partial [Vibrio harveyi]
IITTSCGSNDPNILYQRNPQIYPQTVRMCTAFNDLTISVSKFGFG